MKSELAEAMRRALSGKSGWLVGLDYRGMRVLAAHEPVGMLGLGIVAKIDLDEIHRPFWKARNVVIVITLFLVGFGTFLFTRITRALVSSIEQSGGRLQDFADLTADRFWETDEEFRFTYVSQPKSALIRPPEDFLGKTRWEVAGVDADAPFWRPLRQDVEARLPFRDFRFVLNIEQGEPRHIRISGRPFYNRNGKFKGYRGTSVDEMEEVEIRELVEDNRKRFADSMDRLDAGFALWDGQNRFVWCNQNFNETRPTIAKFLEPGIHFEDYIRKVAEAGDVVDARGREEEWIASRIAQHITPSEDYETHLADGRWLHNQNQRLEDGSVLVFHYDITKRKLAEDSLRDSETRARAFLNATMDPAALIDRNGLIIDLNHSMAEQIGKPLDELIDASLFATFPQEVTDRRRFYAEQVIRTGAPARFNDQRRGRWFESNHYPVLDEDGKVTHVAIFARNITSQKRVERN